MPKMEFKLISMIKIVTWNEKLKEFKKHEN